MSEIENRMELEARVAREMGRLSGSHRRELEELLGNPPDASRVPPSFWDKVQRETENTMLLLLLLIAAESAMHHGLTDQPTAQASVRPWAEEQAATISRQWTDNSKDLLTTGQREWEDRLQKYGEIPRGDVRDRTLKIFGPSRVEGLAVNETTRANHAGGEAAVGQLGGISNDDTWFTAQDGKVCEICGPLHDTPREEWARFFPAGPPAHPRCRCFVVYAIEKAGAVT